jgi:hypothetical protein
MRELEKPVARVFRRLRYQRFLATLVWSWAVALALVAGVIAGEKLMNRKLLGPEWAPFAVAGALGLVIAAGVAIASGPSRLDAAVALDRVFHLNERVSSALTLPGDLRDTPAGRALLADAIKRVADLDLAAEFGLRLPRRAWVVLIPATAAVLLLFAPTWVVHRVLQARTLSDEDLKIIAKKAEVLTKKIASQRQAIDKEKFPEADKLLAKIEKKIDDLTKAPPTAKDKLMVDLNALTDALKERQKQLGNPEQVNRQLQQLKDMSQGPADQFAKDLAKGDFKKAAEELKKLQDKLRSGQMSEAEKKALKEQLGEMAKKLADLANLDQRKKQLEEARKNGGLTQQQFEREMEKLNEQAKALKQLQQLASKLGKAQEALEKGDMKQAADQLGMSQQQMSEMAKQLEELQSLDSALADVQDAKNGMANDGSNQLGMDMNSLGMGNMNQRKGMGNGLGRGRGQGDRPLAEDETATYQSKVKQQLKKGKAILLGPTDPSKTVKGNVEIDIQAEIDAGTGSVADALSNQKIPRSLEKHIRSYYDQLNKGN